MNKYDFFGKVKLIKAEEKDNLLLQELKKESFMEILNKYKDYDTNPALESIEKINKEISDESSDYYIISVNNENIGGIRIENKNKNIYRISPFFIIPKYQGLSIGYEVLTMIFQKYTKAKCFILSTIKEEKRNCHLYEKAGFKRSEGEINIKDNMTIVSYEKVMYTNLLSEYDKEEKAVINPDDTLEGDFNVPELFVMTFTKSIIDKWASFEDSTFIGYTGSANGQIPIYKIKYKNKEIGFCLALVGASICTGIMEDIIALGAKKIVVFGSCGVLNNEIADGHIIIPYEAIRDEGTSYHYAPPSDSIFMEKESVTALKSVMEEFKYKYMISKTWTTDAFYRETKSKVERRKQSGCTVVDMECSALIALSKHRNIKFAQFLYAADNLDSDIWEQRGLTLHQGLSKSDVYMKVAFETLLKL